MRRKARDQAEQGEVPSAGAGSAATDHDRFWAGEPLDADTFARVAEPDEEEVAEETLEYMGTVPRTRVAPAELIALAEWAESKACRPCRKKLEETHDPTTLKHDDCRNGLRIARLLRRYA